MPSYTDKFLKLLNNLCLFFPLLSSLSICESEVELSGFILCLNLFSLTTYLLSFFINSLKETLSSNLSTEVLITAVMAFIFKGLFFKKKSSDYSIITSSSCFIDTTSPISLRMLEFCFVSF